VHDKTLYFKHKYILDLQESLLIFSTKALLRFKDNYTNLFEDFFF